MRGRLCRTQKVLVIASPSQRTEVTPVLAVQNPCLVGSAKPLARDVHADTWTILVETTRTHAQHRPAPAHLPLILGKELRPSAFVNPVNFPLDAGRYDILRNADDDIPPKDEVTEGMGEMLTLIHWQA